MRINLIVFMLLVASVGQAQLMQYDRSKTHYVDRNYPTVKWYRSGSNANIIFGAQGIYRIQIESFGLGIPHHHVQVFINGIKVSQINSGQTWTPGGSFFYSSGANLDIETAFNGNQTACNGGYLRFKLYAQGSGQIIDQMDVNFSTYAPSEVIIEPPYKTVDHKDQVGYQNVTATETIKIKPGVTIKPGGSFWPFGVTQRKFVISTCLHKTEGEESELDVVGDVTMNNQEIAAWPNPSDGRVNLQFSGFSTADGFMDLEVYSLTGKLVFKQQIDPSQGITPIDLSDQPKGMYMLKGTAGERVMHQRVIIR